MGKGVIGGRQKRGKKEIAWDTLILFTTKRDLDFVVCLVTGIHPMVLVGG